MQESIFFAAEALTVIQWGRWSDRIGRRPILLGGMIGLFGSMIGFGLSHHFWSMLLSRCAQGVFNGDIGVTKRYVICKLASRKEKDFEVSVVAEITDDTNIAEAFAFLPFVWYVIASKDKQRQLTLITGLLAQL
jgi:MFS family permease